MIPFVGLTPSALLGVLASWLALFGTLIRSMLPVDGLDRGRVHSIAASLAVPVLSGRQHERKASS